MVTLWAAGEAAPRKFAETQTGTDGYFDMPVRGNDRNEVLYNGTVVFFGVAKPARTPALRPKIEAKAAELCLNCGAQKRIVGRSQRAKQFHGVS